SEVLHEFGWKEISGVDCLCNPHVQQQVGSRVQCQHFSKAQIPTVLDSWVCLGLSLNHRRQRSGAGDSQSHIWFFEESHGLQKQPEPVCFIQAASSNHDERLLRVTSTSSALD